MNTRLGGLFATILMATVCVGAGCGKKPQPTDTADASVGNKKDAGGKPPAPSDGAKAAPTDPITRTAPTHIAVLDKWSKHVKGAGGTPFAFSPDGKTLIVSTREGEDFAPKWKVTAIDPESERPLTGKLPFGEVMLFSTDAFGNTTLDANQLKALALPEAKQVALRDNVMSISRDRNKSVLLAYSPGAEYLALRGNARTGQDASVEVWHVGTKQQVVRESPPKVGNEASVTLAFSPDHRLLAQAADYQVRIWELPSGKLAGTLECAANKYLMFSPDGKWLLTQHFEDGRVSKPKTPDPGKLVLWKVGDWKTSRALHPGGSEHNLGAQCAFSPDGKLLATTDDSAGAIRRVTIWNVETGALRGGFEALEFADLAFSPDGTLLATWGGKLHHSVNFWDVASGQLKHRIKSRFPTLTSFSTNGQVVTVRAEGGVALLYDLSSGTKVPFEDEVKKERDRLAGRK